jgi:hypothetical protein
MMIAPKIRMNRLNPKDKEDDKFLMGSFHQTTLTKWIYKIKISNHS